MQLVIIQPVPKCKPMVKQIKELLQKQYPQNFIVRKPVIGTLLFSLFLFIFMVIYKPLGVRPSHNFSLIVTMFIYNIMATVPVIGLALILKKTNCFSKNKGWTFLKELETIIIVLLGFGICIYFLGFVMEEPSNRWNWPTFFDAVSRVMLIGIVPFLFLTLVNLRYLYTEVTEQKFKTAAGSVKNESDEQLIEINSQLKKEELKFYPGQLLYAESEGNYVVFHLLDSDKPRKVMIRNSISNIEQQLTSIPYFFRIHRAFIVNVKKVSSKKGNSLGYRLKLTGINEEIPVSRQNTQKFDELIRQFR